MFVLGSLVMGVSVLDSSVGLAIDVHFVVCVCVCVCTVFSCVRQWYGCQYLGFLMCAQMLMHAIAHEGCMNTVKESALKVDQQECPLLHWSRELKPGHCRWSQYCAWLFEPTL